MFILSFKLRVGTEFSGVINRAKKKKKSVFQREYLTFNILDKCVLVRILQRIDRICMCVCVCVYRESIGFVCVCVCECVCVCVQRSD